MCFFSSPSMPEQKTVERPAVTETQAPVAQSPKFGTSADNTTTESKTTSASGTRGIESLKIKPLGLVNPVTTGANSYGLNSNR